MSINPTVMSIAMNDMGYLIEMAKANLKYLPGPVINAAGYGATGDGVTDDTGALQEAIDYANQTGRHEVFLPAGTYKYTTLSGTTNIVAVGDGVTLNGDTILPLMSISRFYEMLFKQSPLPVPIQIQDYKPLGSQLGTSVSILRDNYTELGDGSDQYAALKITSNVATSVNNNEIGLLVQLNDIANNGAHVGIYSKVNVSGAVDGSTGAATHCAAFELTNALPGPENTIIPSTTTDQPMCGLEIDIVNSYNQIYDINDPNYSKYAKLGVICVAWGGGQCSEAFSVRSSGGNGDGLQYTTGDWAIGLRMAPASLNYVNGVGISIESDFKQAIRVTGSPATGGYGINLSAPSLVAGTVGLNIGNYPIAVALNGASLKIRDPGSNEMIYYDPGADSTNITTALLSLGTNGLISYTTNATATAGSATLPANPVGFFQLALNGTKYKVPYYNM